MRPLPAFLLFVALAAVASGQPAMVSGTVRDGEGQPLPGVSVYLSGTTRGAASDRDGHYRIEAVTPGNYRLVGSMVGFETVGLAIRLDPGATLTADLSLSEATATLDSVRVEAPADRRWQRHFEQFHRALVGESANADSTRILNPEVLDFSSRWGTLRATARAPLVIENRALGYRFHYDLTAFSASEGSLRYDGDEVFEAMEPSSAAQGFRWAAARQRAWRGSFQHLLRALVDGTAEAEGFTFSLLATDAFGRRRSTPPWPTTGDRQMRTVDGVPTLAFRGELEVEYDREPEELAYLHSEWFHERRRRPAPVQTSALTVERAGAALDPDGTPIDPFAITTSGHMAFERLADRVPRDFVPLPDV